MEDTLTIEEQQVPLQEDPPRKKLYNGLVKEKLYSKSYAEFEKQFSNPESIDKLYQGLSSEKLYSKSREDFQTQYFQDVKKKGLRGSVAFPEDTNVPLPSGGEGGEKVQTVEDDVFSKVGLWNEYKDATKTVAGLGDRGAERVVPDEEKRTKAKELENELKGKNINPQKLFKDFEGIDTQDFFSHEGTTKEAMLKLDKDNPIKYNSIINNAKTVYAINKNSDVATANEFNRLNNMQYGSLDGFISGKKQQQDIINRTLEGNERVEAHRRLEENSAPFINSTNPDLVEEYKQSPLNSKIDPTQFSALKTLEVFQPEKYRQAVDLLNTDVKENVGTKPLKNLLSEELFSSSDNSSKPKTALLSSTSTVDKVIGKETLLRQLSEQGRANLATSINKEQYSLNTEFNNTENQDIKSEIQRKYLQNQSFLNSIKEDAKQDATRYPLSQQLIVDNQVKELTQNSDMNMLEYAGKKFGHGFLNTANTFDDVLTGLFGSDRENNLLQLKRLGEDKKTESSMYLPESLRTENSPYILTATKELKDKAKEIMGDKDLSELSSEQKQKLTNLVKDNQDQLEMVTNPEYGKSKNIFSKGTSYQIAGFTGDIASFMVQTMGLGGVGIPAKAAELTTLFTTTYSPSFTQATKDGMSPSKAHGYAMVHGGIMMLAGTVSSKYEAVKGMLESSKNPLAKEILGIGEAGWNKIVDGNKSIINKIGNATKDIAKENAKMIATYGVGTSIVGDLADKGFFDKNISGEEIVSHALQSAKDIAIGSVALMGAGFISKISKSPMSMAEKAMVWEIGDNPEIGRSKIDESVQKVDLTQQEGDLRKKAIDKISTLIHKVPEYDNKGNRLTDQQRISYLYNSLIKDKSKEAVSDLPEKQGQDAEHKGMVAEYSNQILLDQSTDKQLNDRKGVLERKLEPKKYAEGKVIEIPEKELAQYKAELEAVNDAIENKKSVVVDKGDISGESVLLKTKEDIAQDNGVVVEKPVEVPESIPLKEDKPKNAYTEQYNKALNNPELRETALQDISDQWHDPRSRKLIEESIAPEIIEEAKQKYPQEETTLTIKDEATKENEVHQPTEVKGNTDIKPDKVEPEAETGKEGKFEAKARKLAEKIMESETPDWLKIDDPNVSKKGAGAEEVKKALADATIKMGKLLDKGVEFAEAVKEAVEDLVKMMGEGARKQIEEGFAKDYKEKSGEEFEQRRFTKQMLRSDELSGESKAEISKTLNYVRQKNVVSVKEANEVLEKVGVDEAQSLVMNDSDLKPAVRVTLGQIVIKKYNALSETATDQATKDYYLDKSIQTASFVTEKLGTEAGQSIQAFSMWAQLSPEGQLRAANQDMAAQGKEKLRRREKDIKVISDKFQKANEEAAEEITNSPKVKETVKKTKTAQDKVNAAKKKIDDIIKRHKADKGKNLYAGVGLTKEGIEFVGDLVSAYVQLGGAKLEVVVEKVLAHLKDVSGKAPNDTVRKNVSDLVKERFEKDENARITKGLSELEAEVNKIIKEHYTVSEESKTSLIDKFMDKAGLDKAEATRLAKEVETEFEKIATRKKRNILYNEKARFDKINKTLKGSKTPEQKTLATEIIKYSNLGAFEGKEFGEMIASKFGLGEISPEQAAKLIELANKVEKAAEGSPKNNATEDLLAYRAKLKGNDLGETVQSVWYANVLSGYKTQEKNLVSTFFNSLGDMGAEMMKDPKAIPYIVSGYLKGVGTRGLVEAGNTMKTGYSPIHIKKIEVPNALERKKFIGGAINPGNWLKYVMRTMIATDVLSFQGLKESRAYQLARREVAKGGLNTWSKKGWNEVNKVLLHTKERLEMAEAQVAEEGITGKLEKQRRIYELMEANRPTEMMEDAYGFAAHGTFNHESEGTLGAITNAVAQSLDVVNIGGVKPARFIVPFTRIITNVVNNSLDFSPVGFVRAARGVRGFRSFESNRFTKGAFKELSKDERTTYLAKAALGITLAATFQAMHQAGVIQVTGGGTGNYQKDEQLRQEGWQEYSIKVGGKYYSYKYTPLVFMLGYLGNMNDAEKYSDNDKETILKQMEIATSRIGGQVADMTWINSAATFLGALTEPNPSQQASGLNKSLAGIGRGFVPFAGMVTQLNDAFVTDKKEANSAWQGLMASIPIARNSLDDRINALGDTVKVDSDVIVSKETADPVWKFLLDKQGWVAPVNKNTAIVFDNATKQDRLMTTDEYYNFSKLRGGLIKDGIKTIMNTREIPVVREGKEDLIYVKANDLTKQEFNKILTKIKKQATELAKLKLTGGKGEDDIENDNMIKALNKQWNKEVNEIIEVEEDDN